MNIVVLYALAFLYSTSVFIGSLVIYSYYTKSDLYTYAVFYKTVSTFDLYSGYDYFRAAIGSMEPIYYIIVYFASQIIEKDYFFSTINAFIGFIYFLILAKTRVHFLVFLSLLANYYMLVIYFPAERLKFAFLFFGLSILISKPPKLFFWVLSILSHTQAIYLLYFANVKLFTRMISGPLGIKLNIKNIFLCLVAITTLSVIYWYLESHIQTKILAYGANERSPFDILRPLSLLALTLYYAGSKRLEATAAFLPIIVGSAIVGSDRLTIFAFSIFMYYGIKVRRGLNFGVTIVSFYFLYKSYEFLVRTIEYGHAF